jgi:uncharacterized protein (DUF697 family)
MRLRLPDLEGLLLQQVARSRMRIAELEQRHPGVPRAQLAKQLIEEKKQLATSGGALAGMFGLAAIPADLTLVAFLQVQLAIELAVLHGVNLKGRSGRAELMDVLGLGERELESLLRALPLVAGRIAAAFVRRLGWRSLGRFVPVLAAPISAFVNGRDIQRVGDEALRRFDTFRRVRTIRE